MSDRLECTTCIGHMVETVAMLAIFFGTLYSSVLLPLRGWTLF